MWQHRNTYYDLSGGLYLQASAQGMKRLTLDLPAETHRALKVRSAELEVAMADLLRELIADALRKPSTLRGIADRLTDKPR